jgi:Arc/MetJ-type ribon-helix-helix transcriptional regulator
VARPLKFPQKMLIGLTDEQVAAIDEWRRTEVDLPNRSEAVRRLVEIALAARKAKTQDVERTAR